MVFYAAKLPTGMHSKRRNTRNLPSSLTGRITKLNAAEYENKRENMPDL